MLRFFFSSFFFCFFISFRSACFIALNSFLFFVLVVLSFSFFPFVLSSILFIFAMFEEIRLRMRRIVLYVQWYQEIIDNDDNARLDGVKTVHLIAEITLKITNFYHKLLYVLSTLFHQMDTN